MPNMSFTNTVPFPFSNTFSWFSLSSNRDVFKESPVHSINFSRTFFKLTPKLSSSTPVDPIFYSSSVKTTESQICKNAEGIENFAVIIQFFLSTNKNIPLHHVMQRKSAGQAESISGQFQIFTFFGKCTPNSRFLVFYSSQVA